MAGDQACQAAQRLTLQPASSPPAAARQSHTLRGGRSGHVASCLPMLLFASGTVLPLASICAAHMPRCTKVIYTSTPAVHPRARPTL